MSVVPNGIDLYKPSIFKIVAYFLGYIILHLLIGWQVKRLQKEPEQNKEELKIATFLFKWFPAIYLIIVLGILMFVGI
jgi:biotin transporter BioY